LGVRIRRRLNPVIMRLLASPLHGLLSRDVLVLGYHGRRSGRRYAVPLSYVRMDDCLYLCTRPDGSSWWRNLREGADVELVLCGRRTAARAVVLPSDSAEALAGLRAFVTRNPGTGRLLYQVGTDDGGKPRDEDLAREVLRSVIVRLRPHVP
jgi:hypothetical protein